MTNDLKEYIDSLKVAGVTLDNGLTVYGEIVAMEDSAITLRGVITDDECGCCKKLYHPKNFTGHVNFFAEHIVSTAFLDFQAKHRYSQEILQLKIEEIIEEDARAMEYQQATMKPKSAPVQPKGNGGTEANVWKNYRNGSIGGFGTN